jgi:hypothetical protein
MQLNDVEADGRRDRCDLRQSAVLTSMATI